MCKILCNNGHVLPNADLQQAFNGIVERYHPKTHINEILAFSEYLSAADSASTNHRKYILEALEKIVAKEQILPLALLESLSLLLINKKKYRERCCQLLASCAALEQTLPISAIQALENVLETGDEASQSTAISALYRTYLNGQKPSDNVTQLVESVFVKGNIEPVDTSVFLYELVRAHQIKELSFATYAKLCEFISNDDEDSDLQINCFNIITASARCHSQIPQCVFDTLTNLIITANESTQEQAYYALMTCLSQENNRCNFPLSLLPILIGRLRKGLSHHNTEICQYVACIIGYFISDSAQQSDEIQTLRKILSRDTDVSLERDLFIHHLEKTLEDVDIRIQAVLPLHFILSQGNEGLVGRSLVTLGEVSCSSGSSLELKIKAIEAMGLSARNNKNPFLSKELETIAAALQQKLPGLTRACLNSLEQHMTNCYGNIVFPHQLFVQVMNALHDTETSLQAIMILETLLERSEENYKCFVLREFLSRLREILAQHADDEKFLKKTAVLLSLAQPYFPKEVQQINQILECGVPETLVASEVEKDAVHGEKAPSKKSAERTTAELLSLLKDDNKDNAAITALLKNDVLLHKLEEIEQAFESHSKLLSVIKPICEWNESDCLLWTKTLKENPDKARDPAYLSEIIAVLMRASVLTHQFKPRPSQLISLLLLLDATNKGRLAQIATGEGKSTPTVVMLAALKALQGEKVDVVTSSPLLAFRDANENRLYYKLFGLNVASNWEPGNKGHLAKGAKSCYAPDIDIVYGDANQFQFDLLTDEYKQENTRQGRPYQTVIVDEVDSMLVDEGEKIVSVGSQKPLMANLELLFIAAWIELCRRQEAIKRGEIQLLPESDPNYQKHRTNYLVSVLEEVLLKIIDNTGNELPSDLIPAHLHEYAKKQAPYWARSAVYASEHYTLDKDYVIKIEDGHEVIAPVDHLNTGVTQENSQCDEGLQQFLQLKHGLRFSAENLTGSFISNMAYFKRYKTIRGVTGTLGATDSQELLKDVYDLDLAFIPTHKEKQFEEQPGVLAETEEEWLNEIVASVNQEIKSGAAALVICESISAARKVEEALRKAKINKIRCYTRSDNEAQADISENMDAGEVVVATNLAGRGTNFKPTNKVEENGGLFVCMSFLPANIRVENQGFGRTSRCGNKGKGKLIINKQDALKHLNTHYPGLGSADSVTSLKHWRDVAEEARLRQIKNIELKKLQLKDKLFTKFCDFMQKLRDINKSHAKLDEVEEQWGFWLKDLNRKLLRVSEINEAEIFADYEDFQKKTHDNFVNGTINNPSQWVRLGTASLSSTHHFRRRFGNNEKLDSSKAAFTKAIEQDHHSIAAAEAHYNRAYVYLAENNKAAALGDLHAARNLINSHIIPRLETAVQLLQVNPKGETAANVAQNRTRIHLLKLQLGYIDRDISLIQNSKRDFNITDFRNLESFFSGDTPTAEINELSNVGLSSLYEIREQEEKKKSGVCAWLRRAAVAVLGVCQVIVGVCLTATGNAYAGKAFIQMGVSDILFAVRSAITNSDCSWREYRAHKIVSTAIILATVGIECLREGSDVAKTAAKTTFKEAARNQVIQSVKWGLINEGIHFGLSAVAKHAVASYKEEIRQKIRDTLLKRFSQPDISKCFDQLLLADAINGDGAQATKLQQLAFNIIYPKQNVLANMSEAIFKGIISNQSAVLAAGIKMIDIANAIDRILNICGDFGNEFCAKLPLLVHQLPPVNIPSHLIPDLTPTKTKLFNSIIEQVSRCVMSSIHREALTPMLDMVVAPHIQKCVAGAIEHFKQGGAQSKEKENSSKTNGLTEDSNNPMEQDHLAKPKVTKNIPGEPCPPELERPGLVCKVKKLSHQEKGFVPAATKSKAELLPLFDIRRNTRNLGGPTSSHYCSNEDAVGNILDKELNISLAGGFKQGLGFRQQLVSHATIAEGAELLSLARNPKLTSSRHNIYGEIPSFYVSESGWGWSQIHSKLSRGNPTNVLYTINPKVNLMDQTWLQEWEWKHVNRPAVAEIALDLKYDGIKHQHSTVTYKTDAKLAHDIVFLQDPKKFLTPYALSPIEADKWYNEKWNSCALGYRNAISPGAVRTAQALGLAGTGVAILDSAYEVYQSDRPGKEFFHQSVLLGSSMWGGSAAFSASLAPCGAVGAAFPPAAPVTVPVCVVGLSVAGGVLASAATDAVWNMGESLVDAAIEKSNEAIDYMWESGNTLWTESINIINAVVEKAPEHVEGFKKLFQSK